MTKLPSYPASTKPDVLKRAKKTDDVFSTSADKTVRYATGDDGARTNRELPGSDKGQRLKKPSWLKG